MPQRTLTEEEFTVIKHSLLRAAPDGLDEAGFQRWFKPRFDGAIAEAEHSPAPVTGRAVGRFLRGAGEMLNPVTIAQGLYQAARHPIDTATAIGQSHVEQFRKGLSAQTPLEAGAHLAASAIPLVGPVAAGIGEEIATTGDIASGVGKGSALIAPFAAGGAARARLAQRRHRGDPAILERAAAQQVSQRVLAPGNVAFRGRAEAVAPEVLRRGMKGGREELAQAADEGMAAAGQRIDDAISAGGGGRSGVIVNPIVAQLQRSLDDLLINGEPIEGAAGRVDALRARIAQLERTSQQQPASTVRPPMAPVRVTSFDDLKKVRDEQYRLADEARAYRRMGSPNLGDEGFAAAETGSAIRSQFARQSPGLAEANADYTFFKTLGDVLDPAQGRPKVSAPTQGVTGGAMTSGAVAGSLVSPKIAFVLGVVRPWIQRVRSEPAWQLADAHSKMRLAEAIRNGNVPQATKLMVRMGGGIVPATSPTGFQSRNTAPETP